jgi:amino acid adenylation domain-containing protein
VIRVEARTRVFNAETVLDALYYRLVHGGDEVAIREAGENVTYRALAAQTAALVDHLAGAGVSVGDVVAISLRRGAALYAAMTATLWLGATYVLIDPDEPPARTLTKLNALGARVLLGDSGTSPHTGPAAVHDVSQAFRARPAASLEAPVPVALDALAYVVFTSGSTGRPKAVAVSRRALFHETAEIVRVYDLDRHDVALQITGPSFDVLTEEVLPTLLVGATVAVAPTPTPAPPELEHLLAACGVTVVNIAAPYWDEWMRDLAANPRSVPRSVRLLIVGSDRMYASSLWTWRKHSTSQVMNAYGLSETTITCATFLTDPSQAYAGVLPIGIPFSGTTFYVLDTQLNPVTGDEGGELFIGGLQVADEYVGLPATTADRFVPDPWSATPGARLFRTGDRVRVDGSGNFRFIGRLDNRIKVRGVRIEPEEIEQTLTGHPHVLHATVRVVGDGHAEMPGDDQLVASVIVSRRATLTSSQIRMFLRERLPTTMVPHVIEFDERDGPSNGQSPLAGSTTDPGKPADLDSDTGFTELEELIRRVWHDALGHDVAVYARDASFFEIGGDSLRLIRVQRLLRSELGVAVSAVKLFQHYTVSSLAAYLSTLVEDRPPGNRP